MAGRERDMIAAMNDLFAEMAGTLDTLVTVALFDDRYELLLDGVAAKDAALTEAEYTARGMTALYDAVGLSTLDVGARLRDMPEEERPAKVLAVIVTDGVENASRAYSRARVRDTVTHQQSVYAWEYLFFGANTDAREAAREMGIPPENAFTFDSVTGDGIRDCARRMAREIHSRKAKA